MALAINGTTGISGVDGSASAPAIVGSDSNTGFSFASDTISLNTGGTTRATIDSNGRLGLGVTSPSSLLHLQDGSNTVVTLGNSGSGDGIIQYFNGSLLLKTQSSGGDRTINLQTSGSSRMLITSDGKVGIGTTSPSCTKFNVAVDSSVTSRVSENTVQIQNTNDGGSTCAGIVLAASTGSNTEFNIVTQKHSSGTGADFHLDNGTDALLQISGDNGDMKFGESGTMISTFTPGYNNSSTGIGVEPRNGSIFLSRSDGAPLYVNTNTADVNIVAFSRQGSVKGRVFMQTNTVSYATSSDYRLKENAVAISDGITRLKTLKPYRFNFKDDPSKTVDGFFAHEVTAVPEAVSGTKDETKNILYTEGDTIPEGKKVGDIKETVPEYQGLDYGRITPLLTAALQEAVGKIETLETKVAALEAA